MHLGTEYFEKSLSSQDNCRIDDKYRDNCELEDGFILKK